jgi:hypothetical protein
MPATVPCEFGGIRSAIKVEHIRRQKESVAACRNLSSSPLRVAGLRRREIRLMDKAGVSYASGPFDRMTTYKLTDHLTNCSNALDFYSGDVRFDSVSGYHLSSRRFIETFPISLDKYRTVLLFGHGRFLPNTFQFIFPQSFYQTTLYTLHPESALI